MLSATLRSWTVSVPPELMVIVESSVPGAARSVAAGIDWSTAVELKACGPVIMPSGPVIDSDLAGVKLLVCIGRSKVTWNWLVVSLISRSVVPVESWPEVPTACVEAICGPGTISGRVFWLNGGLRMLCGGGERDRRRQLGRGHRVDVARRRAGVAVGQRHRVLVGGAVGVLVDRSADLDPQGRQLRVDRDRPAGQRADVVRLRVVDGQRVVADDRAAVEFVADGDHERRVVEGEQAGAGLVGPSRSGRRGPSG